ncbi:MAG: hypothetical protein K5896_07510 [Prevotella sp.]|nr:hypothetical protein [Prevotella sp.]
MRFRDCCCGYPFHHDEYTRLRKWDGADEFDTILANLLAGLDDNPAIDDGFVSWCSKGIRQTQIKAKRCINRGS